MRKVLEVCNVSNNIAGAWRETDGSDNVYRRAAHAALAPDANGQSLIVEVKCVNYARYRLVLRPEALQVCRGYAWCNVKPGEQDFSTVADRLLRLHPALDQARVGGLQYRLEP